MNVFASTNMLIVIISWGLLALMAFALIDVVIRPTGAFVAASKQTKPLWVVLIVVGFALSFLLGPISIFGMIGVVATLVYLLDVRPAVRAVSRGGSSSSGSYDSW